LFLFFCFDENKYRHTWLYCSIPKGQSFFLGSQEIIDHTTILKTYFCVLRRINWKAQKRSCIRIKSYVVNWCVEFLNFFSKCSAVTFVCSEIHLAASVIIRNSHSGWSFPLFNKRLWKFADLSMLLGLKYGADCYLSGL